MEKRSAPAQRLGLTELMRLRRRDPGGDIPFDPDEETLLEEERNGWEEGHRS